MIRPIANSPALGINCVGEAHAYVGGESLNQASIGSATGSNVYVMKYLTEDGRRVWLKSLRQSGATSPDTEEFVSIQVLSTIKI